MNDRTTITATTPAKLNLGLEVIRRRADGYHEIVSILQAIDLVDRFIFEPSDADFEYHGPPSLDPADDMVRNVFAQAGVMAGWSGRLKLEKEIPVAAGLGGGSSNAAFALRLSRPDLSLTELSELAARVGSDVPFFIQGGTALATGTGTELKPLPTPPLWFVLVVPQLSIANKTATLYKGLEQDDYSTGGTVLEAARAIERGEQLRMPLPNVFTRQMRSIPAVERAWTALQSAGAENVMLSGAGPAIFAPVAGEDVANQIAFRLDPSAGSVKVVRSLPSHGDDSTLARLHDALSRRGSGH